MNRITIARQITSSREIFISPNGMAHATWRIGEAKGRLISTSELSDKEIEQAGLTGKVNKASSEANRLYG